MSHTLESWRENEDLSGAKARAVRRKALFRKPTQEERLAKFLKQLEHNTQYGPSFPLPKSIQLAPCKNAGCQKTDKQHQLWRDRHEPIFRCANCGQIIPDQVISEKKIDLSLYPKVKMPEKTSKTKLTLSTAGGW